MLLLQLVALTMALILIFRDYILTLLPFAPSFGYELQTFDASDQVAVLFWSTLVFLFFFVRFHEWADAPPIEFARTPPAHCTTRGRYLFAQLCYAATILLVFLVLAFIPQLISEILRAIRVLIPGLATSAVFDDPELAKNPNSFRLMRPAIAAPYAALALMVAFAKWPELQEPRVRAFFQRRALIPSEARRLIAEIGDGATTFKSDPNIANRIYGGPLKGLVTPGATSKELTDIYMAEYIYYVLKNETDARFDTARRSSDFNLLSSDIESAREDLQELVTDSHDLISAIRGDSVETEDDPRTLDQIDQMRDGLDFAKRRVFDRAMRSRRRSVLQGYTTLREGLLRLMTTLVLASEHSAATRSSKLKEFGFELETTDAPIPRYIMPATFLVLFVIYLLGSCLYWVYIKYLFDIGSYMFDLGDYHEIAHMLRIDRPGTAVLWAVVGALMQMVAVFLSLAAWSLSPDYHFFERAKRVSVVVYFGAWLNGFIFGFVSNVMLFFFLGIAMRDQTILPLHWPWTLLGAISGAFLLVQGINVRRGEIRTAVCMALIQGVVSAMLAGLVTVLWGLNLGTAPQILVPFGIIAIFNALVAGTALGLLAIGFMRSRDLSELTAAGEMSK